MLWGRAKSRRSGLGLKGKGPQERKRPAKRPLGGTADYANVGSAPVTGLWWRFLLCTSSRPNPLDLNNESFNKTAGTDASAAYRLLYSVTPNMAAA